MCTITKHRHGIILAKIIWYDYRIDKRDGYHSLCCKIFATSCVVSCVSNNDSSKMCRRKIKDLLTIVCVNCKESSKEKLLQNLLEVKFFKMQFFKEDSSTAKPSFSRVFYFRVSF